MPDDGFDIVVIGAGSGGVACATALAQGGKRVAIVERERVGGECAYWACVPSKVLLRSADPNVQSAHVPGSREARGGAPSFAAAAAWRTAMSDNYDDGEHARQLRTSGVTLLRGEAAIAGPRRVRVGTRELAVSTIVLATGSESELPSIPGLADGPVWTTREATAAAEPPAQLMLVGGGAAGVELAQAFARYGSAVTVIEAAEHLLPEEEPAVGELARAMLERDGVAVRTRATAERVTWSADGACVELAGGDTVEGARLCVATGRTMRTRGLGLERAGVAVDARGGVAIDAQCRVADGMYAVGDVTGKALFTHVAKYQGRVAAAAILGRPAAARYDAIPRCVYTAPEIAAAGLTRKQAAEQGIEVASGRAELHEVTRAAIFCEDGVDGAVELLADAGRGTLVGGWIVAPAASEMIGFLTSALVNATPLRALLDVVQPYPTFGEAFYVALDRLQRAVG